MKTIKIPIKTNELQIKEIQRQCSIVIRFAYNRFKENKTQKEIEYLCKKLNNISSLSPFLIQCLITKSKSLFEKKHENIIFGSTHNFIQRCKNKISKEQFKENRLLNIYSIGQSNNFGNRMFDFNIIEENKIIFKLNRKDHIDIQLPKLRKNIKQELYKLQELMQQKKIPVTIELNSKEIFIIFEESFLYQKEKLSLNENRVLGLDLNPNFIGLNISEFDKNENQKILYSCVYDLSKLTIESGKSSNSKESKYINNKRKFETFQICKQIHKLAIHFQCSKICIEDLNIKLQNHNKGTNFNRLVNNKWNKKLIINNLKKRTNISGIKFVEVNPAYSSFIGNILHGEKYPDQIASSIEISRRGYFKFIKNKFYPKLISIEDLQDQWKKTTNQSFNFTYKDWKELFLIFKNSKMKYRVLLNEINPLKVFSLNNLNSNIKILQFI